MKFKAFLLAVISFVILLVPVNVKAASPSATLIIDGTVQGDYNTVQEAIDQVTLLPGIDFIIEISEGVLSDSINIIQQTGKNLTLRPKANATVTITNTVNIDGNGNLASEEALVIQGFTFDFTSGTAVECIYFKLIDRDTGFCYAHNVTINGCTFIGIEGTTVAVQSIPGGMRNISMMNSTGENLHSILQLKAVSGYLFVQNVTLTNSENGINFYGTANVLIDSSNISVNGYAFRSGQGNDPIEQASSITINNSILQSNSTEDGTVVFRGRSPANVYITHSDITNTNGAAFQNLVDASKEDFNIWIVESNITGQFTNIDDTIRTVDDPNVPNGPLNINITNNSTVVIVLFFIIVLLVLTLIIMAFLVNGQNLNFLI